MALTGCLRCDTPFSYYMHDHRQPANPGTTYLELPDGEPDGTQDQE